MSRRGHSEGTIHRRNDGRWAAALSLGHQGGRRRRRYFYGKTRAEVAKKLQEAQRTVSDGGPIPPERQTVATLLETWLENGAARRVRPRTIERYKEIVSLHLIPSLGDVRLSKLSPVDVEKMMSNALAKGAAPRSVSHFRAVLRTALNAGMRWGWINRNAAALCEPPRVGSVERRVLGVADAKAVLEAVRGDRLEALYTVSLACGLRQGEALALDWAAVDLDSGAIRVARSLERLDGQWHFSEPKTRSARRVVPLPEPVTVALRGHRSRQLQERLQAGPAWEGERWGALVFVTETGSPLSGSHVLRRLRKLLAMASLDSMRYHDLRHGAASLMAAQGVPPRVAMEVLGHADFSTTMNIYAHVAPDVQRDAAEKIGTALWA